jgi:very-short-patch-repair endonuclease
MCKNCNTEFSIRKSRFKKGQVKYCSIKCRNSSEEWISSNILKNYNQLHKIGLNKLELAGRDLLNKIGIDFVEQKLLGDKFVVDVFIPHKNLIIQWDGDYWHGHPKNQKNGIPNKLQLKNIKKDKRVNAELNKMGYNVLRFWQDDVDNNPSIVIETINKKLHEI